MNPIESWVDVDELRRMADALLLSPDSEEEPSTTSDEAVFGSRFEGYEAQGASAAKTSPKDHAEPVEESARHSLAAARELAQRGGLLTKRALSKGEQSRGAEHATKSAVTASTAPVAHRKPDNAQIIAQLKPLGPWLKEAVQASSYFILNREGVVIAGGLEDDSAKLYRVARTVAQAVYTANRHAGAAAVGNLHIKISPATVMEVIPVNTSEGSLILGILVPRPLSAQHVELAARGLLQVLDAAVGP